MADYKIIGPPGLPVIPSVAANDVLPIVDVSTTTGPTAGPGGADSSVETAVLAAAFAELTKTMTWIEPTGDTSGVTDTAAIMAALATGLAILAPGVFYVTNLTIDTGQELAGFGWASVLTAATGTTGAVLALTTPATSCQTTVRNLKINCANVCAGVKYDNTGFDAAVQWVPYDPIHTINDVLLLAANGDAFHFDNQLRSMRFTNNVQYNCSGYGLYCGDGAASGGVGVTDNHFTNFISGHSGLDGMHFEAASGNNVTAGCKAFYAGYSESSGSWTSTTAVGLYDAASNNRHLGFSCQQNALHGISLNSSSYTTVVGAQCDTNSAGTGVTAGCGINLTGTIDNVSVIGATGNVNTFDPPGVQAYGIQLDGTLTNTSIIGNSITGTNDGINETGSFVDGGGNTIVDSSQFTLDASQILRANPGSWYLGQTSVPAAQQYFAGVWGNDPAGNGYANLASITGAGLAGNLQQSQLAAVSAVTVASSTAIHSIGSLTIPANDPCAGARYKVTAHGTVSTEATPGVVTIDLRWGGTTGTLLLSIVSATSAPAITASMTTQPILIEGEIEFLTTTTVVGWLRVTYRPAAATAPVVWLNSITSAVTVSISAAEALSLDWTWATSNASNTVTIASSSFERVA